MEKAGKSAITATVVIGVLAIIVTIVFGVISIFDTGTITSTEIKNINYVVDVQENGDMQIEETLTYDADDINGIIRNYQYSDKHSQSIEIQSVLIDHKTFANLKEYASKGDRLVYTVKDYGSDQKVQIYYPADGNVDFTINYKVSGLITEYNDVQDLYWKFYDSLGESVPEKATVTINFPESIGIENMKVFGHGDVAGNLKIVDDKTVQINIDGFYTESFAEVRVLLLTKPLNNVALKNNKNELDSILNYELGEAEKTNKQIEKNAQKEKWSTYVLYTSVGIVIITILLYFIVIRKIYNKFDKEKYSTELDYYREVPILYGPAVAALVANSDQDPDQKQLIATLFNLYIKKYVKLDLVEKDKKNTEVEITLLKTIEEAKTNLDAIDYDLYSWMVRDFGEAKIKTYEAFLRTGNDSETLATSFMNSYNSFLAKIKSEYRKLNYEEYNGKHGAMPKLIWLPIILILLFGAGVSILYFMGMVKLLTLIAIAIQVVLLLVVFAVISDYKNNCYQLSKDGAEQKAINNGLKNYLNDYSLLNEAAPSAVNMWEKYFVFGLSLGVTEEALNKLYEKIPQTMQSTSTMETIYMMHMLSYRHHIVNTSYQTLQANEQVIQAATTSRSSGGSSFGGGGGFSGGGGFGGGGGGSSSF